MELATVRRALLLAGDLKTVAAAALTGGAAALAGFQLTVGRPLAPMLAQSAPSVAEALTITGTPAAADVKLDGIRIQVHRDGDDVAVFSRSLDDLTARVPAVVAAVRALPARALVLDGEAMGLAADGWPLPFQEISSRAAQRKQPSAQATLLVPFFFDLLHLDGQNLLDEPARTRWSALTGAVPGELLVTRTEVADPDEAAAAFAAAVDAGQEGLVIKSLDAGYDVGRRGGSWVKVKPRHTLDLVVLAAEWGHGRRRGWLSNLHLGARDPETGGFVMLGKTFKGLTDELLRWQTEKLRELAVDSGEWVVRVRPELVVEIAFDGVQTSPGTRAAWPCASPASCATGRTRPPPRRTPSTRYAPSTPADQPPAASDPASDSASEPARAIASGSRTSAVCRTPAPVIVTRTAPVATVSFASRNSRLTTGNARNPAIAQNTAQAGVRTSVSSTTVTTARSSGTSPTGVRSAVAVTSTSPSRPPVTVAGTIATAGPAVDSTAGPAPRSTTGSARDSTVASSGGGATAVACAAGGGGSAPPVSPVTAPAGGYDSTE